MLRLNLAKYLIPRPDIWRPIDSVGQRREMRRAHVVPPMVRTLRFAHPTTRLRFQHLHLRRCPHAQEGEIAADREEAEAALGREHGALRIRAKESRDFVRLG